MEEEIKFDHIPDDVVRVINSFLDFRSTANFKSTCKRYNSLLDYNFYEEEYAKYNQSYKGIYPLLIEDQRELVVKTNGIRGICTICNEEKFVNEFGMINLEEEIKNPEKFKRLKLRNIFCENITLCSFSNLNFLHLHKVAADYFHFPIGLNTIALEQCEIDDIILPKNLEYLLLDTVDIESIEVNDNLKVIHVTDSSIGLEGDPLLKAFVAARTRFYQYQTIYGIDLEVLILVSTTNMELENVTTDKLYLKDTNAELEPGSYKEFMNSEELKIFKID